MRCDFCKTNKAEIDGKTGFGFWANMCPECHCRFGVGFGVGRGQYLDPEKERQRKIKAGEIRGAHKNIQ